MAYGSTQPNNYAGPVNPGDMVVKNDQASPGIAALLRKQNMKGAQGIFQLPEAQQPNPDFYNQSLMNVQNEIQGQTQTLNAMAPEGEQLAYINDQEAGILKMLGGSGDMTPQGIPSYRPPNQQFQNNAAGQKAEAREKRDTQKAEKKRQDDREKAAPVKEQNIFQKILGGGNQEVKDIASNVNSKIKEVKSDPNLSNFEKMQMVKQLNFAKSGEGRKTGYSMGELSQNIMRNVDQNRVRSIRLSGKDAEMLAAQGVITQDQLTDSKGLIEKYGRGLSYNPATGALTIAQPTSPQLRWPLSESTMGEAYGDFKRGLSSTIKNFPNVSPLGLLMKTLGKGGDEEEKAPTERETDFQKQVQDILNGTDMGMGPGQAIAMYGKSTPYKSGEEVAIESDYEDDIMKIARGDRTKEDYYSGANADEAQYLNDLIEDAMRQDGSTSPINVNPNKSYNLPDKFVVNKKTKPTSAREGGEFMGGLNASFFDPATGGIGYNLGPNGGKGTDGFVNQNIIGQPAMTPQMSGAVNRIMNPRDNANQSSVVSNTGTTQEDDATTEDDEYPYFGYQRQFQAPMTFEDLIARAYTSDPNRINMLESFGDMFKRRKESETA